MHFFRFSLDKRREKKKSVDSKFIETLSFTHFLMKVFNNLKGTIQ